MNPNNEGAWGRSVSWGAEQSSRRGMPTNSQNLVPHAWEPDRRKVIQLDMGCF